MPDSIGQDATGGTLVHGEFPSRVPRGGARKSKTAPGGGAKAI